MFRLRANAKQLAATGQMETATVVSVRQTGVVINQQPQMELVLDIQMAGAAARRLTTRQILDLSSIPRAGDLIYVIVDPANPETVMLAGAPQGKSQGPRPTLVPQAVGSVVVPDLENDPQVQLDYFSIAPRLREHGPRAVATILNMSRTTTTATLFELEIDAINAPKRRVMHEQVMYGEPYSVGDRIYLLTDDENPDSFAIVPLSWTGGQKIQRSTNRLDALVLGPAMLKVGAKAQGTVLAAERVPMGNAALEQQGFSKWHLRVHIVPEDSDAPYEAEQDIGFTTPEKAARIAQVGAVVPIRYDRNDPKSFATDSIAMGYGDPYEAAIAAMKQTVAAAPAN